MQLDADWLRDPAVTQVTGALTAAGHRALFVGGCVRNALIGAGATDIDIATDATPDQTTAAARAARLRAVPTGADHGTITVIADGRGFEVTTFRRDVETDGRRALVAFSDRLEDDARRRDFTMNALYATPDGEVIDPVGGLPDLHAGRVRFIDDAGQRIAEDYLRILRFFRFHAWFGRDGLDAQALAAIAVSLDGLETLSKERVGAEMRKLLAAPDPVTAVAAMERAGVLARILPGASARFLGPVLLMESQFSLSPDWLRRLIAVGGADRTANLRLSRSEDRRLAQADQAMGLPLAEAAYRFGTDTAFDVALTAAAAAQTPPSADLPDRIAAAAAARFPVAAADLPGFSGRALGRRLKTLESAWIDSGFALSRDELLALP